jgi:hypothetical protein
MKILCKDQETLDGLLALCDKYPQSLGHVRDAARVITPAELMDMIRPGGPSTTGQISLVDMDTVKMLEEHESMHDRVREEWEQNQKVEVLKNGFAPPPPKEVVLKVPNNNPGLVSRFKKVIGAINADFGKRSFFDQYLAALASESNGIIEITTTIVETMESIAGIDRSSRVAIVGGPINNSLAKAMKEFSDARISDFEGDHWPVRQRGMNFPYATEKGHSDYDLPGNSKKEVVVTKSGHRYPRPKRKW